MHVQFMTANCPTNKRMEFKGPKTWPGSDWSIEVKLNGYEVNHNAGSVTDSEPSKSVRQPTGNGETDRTIL